MENQRINHIDSNTQKTVAQTSGNRSPANRGNSEQTRTNTGRRSVSNSSGSVSSLAGRNSDYGVTRNASSLHQGDVIRGEISDLRGNTITVTLENNTVVKGAISDSSMLSIGQRGSFRLSSLTPGGVLLEPVGRGYSENELTLIGKALDEAGLPSTERNQAAVKALMDNMLPINKESIQMLMQQSYDYETNDMSTLAVMNRLMMKMDTESVRQFSNYRNDSSHILNQINELSAKLPDLLETLSNNGPAEAVARFGEQLLSITLLPSNISNETAGNSTIAMLSPEDRESLMTLLSQTPMTDETLKQLENGTLSIRDAITMLRDGAASSSLTLPDGMDIDLLRAKLSELEQLLEPAGENSILPKDGDFIKNASLLTAENTENIENMTDADQIEDEISAEQNASEDTAASGNRFAFAGKLLQTITETTRQTINNTLQFFQNSSADSSKASETHTVFDSLAEHFLVDERQNDSLGSYLSQSERTNLLNAMQNMPLSKSMQNKILSGEASSREVLSAIRNLIPLSDADDVRELFKLPAFETLFEKNLQSTWTLTPKELSEKDALSSFYQNMKNQMSGLQNLIESSLNGQDSDSLKQSARDMESNIQFMKTLNEMFSYMQLPLKLQNQNTHGDLYVYTQKEKLRKNPGKVHVLLHLDLENLGIMDIYIDKDHNNINTRFLFENEDSIPIIKTNTGMLVDALSEQGYMCNITVEQSDTKTSTVSEFINAKINTSATTEMKRFSFDIRA